ncbi:MAG: universal stress protein [Verrucomicrobia bacterium]|nr:universal stress protein [Verrucomicrobiota bacterium]
MKFKPTTKSGGVLVELGPKEAQLPVTSAEKETAALPVFKLKKILVPVDFSDCSNKALHYAIPFARQFDAELILLHVVQPYVPVPEMPTIDIGLLQSQMRGSGEKELKTLQRKVAGEVSSEIAVRVGTPYMEIIKAVKELDVDLVILATHGRTGLAHVFLGSTAERVVRHAGCPVLVVRERERDFVATQSGGTKD